jgi:translation initiation factor IF-2
MTSGAPDCVLLMVGGNAGMIGMSKEHLAIALALSVPVVVAITKVRKLMLHCLLCLTCWKDRHDSRERLGRNQEASDQNPQEPGMQEDARICE